MEVHPLPLFCRPTCRKFMFFWQLYQLITKNTDKATSSSEEQTQQQSQNLSQMITQLYSLTVKVNRLKSAPVVKEKHPAKVSNIYIK